MLNNISGELCTSKAVDSVMNRQTNHAQVFIPQKPQDTGNLIYSVANKIGAGVMLTDNADVTDGLTNEAYGKMSKIVKGFT